ncbi:MAG: TetR/AcrR family transcriptional regulator [Solirubrobacteraceae bacterium]
MALVTADLGYVETRVDDVITRAGVSRRTFYQYFSDREDCFFAVYELIREGTLTRFTPDPEADGTPQERLAAAVGRGLEYFAAWPHHAHVLLVDIVSTGPKGATRHEETMAQLAKLLVDCEAWSPRDWGELDDNDQAQALIGAMHRVVAHRIADGRHATLGAVAQGLTALALPSA